MLAAAGLAAHIVWWEVGVMDYLAWVIPLVAIAALLASAVAVLLRPRRRRLATLGIASFVAAAITLALWWMAVWQIAESS